MGARQGFSRPRSSLQTTQTSPTPQARRPEGLAFALADFSAICLLPIGEAHVCPACGCTGQAAGFWALIAGTTVLLAASHGIYHRHRRTETRRITHCFLASFILMLSLVTALNRSALLMPADTMANTIAALFMLTGYRIALERNSHARAKERAEGGPLLVCYDRIPTGISRSLQAAGLGADPACILHLNDPNADQSSGARTHPRAFVEALLAYQPNDVVIFQHPSIDCLAWLAGDDALSDLLSHPLRIWLAVELGDNLPELITARRGPCRIVPIIDDDLIHASNPFKRAFDIAGAACALILCAPVLLACAVLVRASGPGPIVFRQLRTGAHGRPFTVLKFRTMTHRPGCAFAPAVRDDPRVTKIGRFLRKTGMDEFLQLFNVLRGDMSLVGPRPHAPETLVQGVPFENAVHLYRARHRVRPGITGLAQIRGQRGETSAVAMLDQRLASDLGYIRSWSIWLDIAILLRTIPILFCYEHRA